MICLKDIVKTYNKGKSNAYEALHGISMEIKDGEMTAVIGTSGAGKSTLLHILASLMDMIPESTTLMAERWERFQRGRWRRCAMKRSGWLCRTLL